jgi:peptidoglycan/xylan/chitin deacetylase (PgdA/CDA1 family)
LSRLIYNGVSGRNEVAITIDAGADRGWAEEMLDVLAANGVKVTWGMTGAWAAANPDLIERMVDEGHQIMNHTWSHPSFTGVSASPAMTSSSARKSELTRTADYVYNLTGYRMSPYWRPPYGDINTSVRRDAYDAGYWQTVMWSIDSMGWNGASVSQILNKCAWGAKAGDIILLHVGYSSKDYASLQQMITILQNRGFALVTVEELLG